MCDFKSRMMKKVDRISLATSGFASVFVLFVYLNFFRVFTFIENHAATDS